MRMKEAATQHTIMRRRLLVLVILAVAVLVGVEGALKQLGAIQE